jgi:hypothetical protein
VRAGALLGVSGVAVSSLALAAPASAKVPEGWSNPERVAPWEYLLVLVAIPVGLALLIALFVYVPALVRGERVAPGTPTVEDQWFGGPRQGTAELAGPDDENSRAGGASARW